MQSAALLFLASCVSVIFGWEPMPDDPARYEYTVQLEPELAATLRAGQTIPITSDIPAEVGPIGRIRIVVGTSDLPRRHVVTDFKPLPPAPALSQKSGVVETQYTVPPVESNGARYNNGTTMQILPPGSGGGPPEDDAFTRSLQEGAEANSGGAILPPGETPRYPSATLASERYANNWDISESPGGSASGGAILPPGGDSDALPANDPITPNWQDGASLGNSPAPSWASTPTSQPIAGRANPTSPRGEFSAPWPAVRNNPPMTPIFTASSNPSPTKSAADWPHASGPTFPELQPTNPLPNTPAVTSDMLQQPANAPIEASNGQPAQPTIAMTPPVANQGPPETTATGSPTTPSAQTAGGNQFPLLLSWVLLTGSGAGNIYLFWSYFDLRNKYRGLAYSTGRKELARYTEYDDRD